MAQTCEVGDLERSQKPQTEQVDRAAADDPAGNPSGDSTGDPAIDPADSGPTDRSTR
jgi:hypothetical protein